MREKEYCNFQWRVSVALSSRLKQRYGSASWCCLGKLATETRVCLSYLSTCSDMLLLVCVTHTSQQSVDPSGQGLFPFYLRHLCCCCCRLHPLHHLHRLLLLPPPSLPLLFCTLDACQLIRPPEQAGQINSLDSCGGRFDIHTYIHTFNT